MDGVLIVVIAVVMWIYYGNRVSEEPKTPTVTPITFEPNPMLNPEMIHDEQAFMRVANELGFY